MKSVTLPQIAASIGTSKNSFRIWWNVQRPTISKQKIKLADTGRFRDGWPYADVVSYLNGVMPHRFGPLEAEKLHQIMVQGKHLDEIC